MPHVYAKAVTRVSLAKAVGAVETGAKATNTFPPVRAHKSFAKPKRGAPRAVRIFKHRRESCAHEPRAAIYSRPHGGNEYRYRAVLLYRRKYTHRVVQIDS